MVALGLNVCAAEIWDASCERSIKALDNTQKRIQTVRGSQIANELQGFSQDLSFGGNGLDKYSRDQEAKLRKLVEEFNHRLKEFSKTCLENPAT